MREDPRLILKRAFDRVTEEDEFFQPWVHVSPEHDPYQVLDDAKDLDDKGVPIILPRTRVRIAKHRKLMRRKQKLEKSKGGA